MTALPYSERVLNPESSCEAKSLALMVMRDLYGIDIMDPADYRPGNLADRVMRHWESYSDVDIPLQVATELRCRDCSGVGERFDLDETCAACEGRGWRMR